ncbi:hypothetical protein Acsp04_53100 [Actinomadura sp. NBRC 104425]|uniref:hypothetical protein n=1 Tax=Actinomadura sp. NBRC 104425 TaxID=3032204 RepID=UPI0024A0C4B4|nr:hypothetical protein [Actinomadura sp. NBRC 104425]GLZ15075.1 hypothetical protein Acsp04_53100 [Actinomadura sp. NBRC 104425]
MFLRRCAFIACWLVLVLFVVRHPGQAADATGALAHALAVLADAVALITTAL